MQPTKVFSFITWFVLFFLAVPSFLVLASWNSLPGDALYGVKRGLEEVLLTLVSPSKDLSATVSVKYSERRFSEANSLLTEKHSIVGLAYFEQQVQETQNQILAAPNVQTQNQLTTQMVNNLVSYQAQLETTKTQITSSNANNIIVTQAPTVNNLISNMTTTTITPTVVVVTSTPVPKREPEVTKSVVTETPVTLVPIATTSNSVQPATNAQIVAAIDQTQEHITQTIKELENKDQKDNNQNNQDSKQKDNTDQQKKRQKNKGD